MLHRDMQSYWLKQVKWLSTANQSAQDELWIVKFNRKLTIKEIYLKKLYSTWPPGDQIQADPARFCLIELTAFHRRYHWWECSSSLAITRTRCHKQIWHSYAEINYYDLLEIGSDVTSNNQSVFNFSRVKLWYSNPLGWFTLDAAVCVFRSGLCQCRDRIFFISLQKCNCLLQAQAENAVMWMSL